MYKILVLSVFCSFLLIRQQALAQDLKTTVNDNKELDSLRKQLDGGADSVVFTSKYVRFTTLRLTKDSIQTFPLDTSLRNFQNYSPISQPRRPTIGPGNLGLAIKPLLYEPNKTIGFDLGFRSLDIYAMTNEDVIYYQARSPFSNLYYMGAGKVEQIFKVTHAQNIKKNWSIGANYFRIGADGIYAHQRGDVLNGSIVSWYQSPGKRYNLWVNAVFNTMKAEENGGLLIDPNANTDVTKDALRVNLNTARQLSRKNAILIKQSYFIGRIDTVAQEVMKKVLPTNKITYQLQYNNDSFSFLKNEQDDFSILPQGLVDPNFTRDSTNVKHLQNEFIYSFFLRGKSNSMIKNELKVDLGIRHDYYKYMQLTSYADYTDYYRYASTFQNASLLGALGYRFSNRVDLNVDVQQIFQGKQIGDFRYEAKSNVLLSRAAGRIVLGAYLQNKSPEELYNRYFGNHYQWTNNFDRTKTVNFSFNYLNDKYQFEAGAAYNLINDYLYFAQSGEAGIAPQQYGSAINLLKVTLGKKLKFGKFNLESYVAYQKSGTEDILRTPEVYTFNSFYLNQTFFKFLKTDIGFDVKYNTPYLSYAYSPAASQFYIPTTAAELKTEPVVDVWVRVSLRKANLFVKYDYVNQGLFSTGYNAINNYLMPDRMLKFGVSWNFYD